MGAGGSGHKHCGSRTRSLRERAVLARNSAGARGCGFKKTVPRRALLCSINCEEDILLGQENNLSLN